MYNPHGRVAKTLTTSLSARRALDLVYPPRCVSCGSIGQEVLCSSCHTLIQRLYPPLCDVCGSPITGEYCTYCSGLSLFFDHGAAYGTYNGALRRAILNLKYRRWLRSVEPLSAMLIEAFQADWNASLQTADCVVPVPIHRRRFAERGFNQSEQLALPFCKTVGLPLITNALQRVHFARPQVGLSGTKRWENVQNAFQTMLPEQVHNRHVLLIDDVMTTGGTCNACARALKGAGAIRVSVLTVAKEIKD
jgi:ComF family protein